MKQFSKAGVLVHTSYFSQQCRRVTFALHPCYHLILVVFSFSDFLVDIKYFYIVALICISLITYEIELLFIYLLSISISSLWITFSSFCHLFFNWIVYFLQISRSSLYILTMSPFWSMCIAGIFSCSVSCLLTLTDGFC